MRKKRFRQNYGNENSDVSDVSIEGNINKRPKFDNTQRKPIQMKKIDFPQFICTKCEKPIYDLTSAIADKESGQPVHFDCVINFLRKYEDLKQNEEVVYIGNGNFAVVYFENPKIRRNFKIIKLIEWEEKNKLYSWKSGVADLASKV